MLTILTHKLPDGREAIMFLRGSHVWLAVFIRRGERLIIQAMGPVDDVIDSEFPDEQKNLLQGIALLNDPDEQIYMYLRMGH